MRTFVIQLSCLTTKSIFFVFLDFFTLSTDKIRYRLCFTVYILFCNCLWAVSFREWICYESTVTLIIVMIVTEKLQFILDLNSCWFVNIYSSRRGDGRADQFLFRSTRFYLILLKFWKGILTPRHFKYNHR